MSLWKYSRREFTGRPGRTILTLLSIVIGVGTAVSVALSTAAARKATNRMTDTALGRVSLEVVSLDGQRFGPAVVDPISDIPGVISAEPIVRQGTIMYYSQKKKGLKILAVGMDFD